MLNPLKWCEICKRMTNHETMDYYYKPRYERTQSETIQQGQHVQNAQIHRGRGERARPVQGVQPPIPGSRALIYVDAQEGGSFLEMVLARIIRN